MRFQAYMRNLTIATVLLAITGLAQAVQVRDICRLKGSERNKLIGMGLVVGLNGTGDGGDFPPSARMLASAIAQFHDPNVVASDLIDTDSAALVYLTADIPAEGVAEGDLVDVRVTTAGPAESLEGGTLFMVPMTGPLPGAPVMAYAEGLVTLPDDDIPTAGVITEGAQMTLPIETVAMDDYYRLRLVIDEAHAGWPTANALAAQINGSIAPDGPNLAEVKDEKSVLVTVPMAQRDRPSQFIADVMTTFIDMSFIEGGAVVVINERTGAVVITGDVRVSPMLIRHDALTITTLDPEPIGNPFEPIETEQPFAAIDPENRGGTRLADLMTVFNQLKVPSEDLIDIIKSMHEAKKLHAKLIIN